jgi:hypothetical protein
MYHPTLDLRSILCNKGSLIIDASKYDVLDLQSLANAATTNGCTITFKNLTKFTILDINAIASNGKRSVIFDFT